MKDTMHRFLNSIKITNHDDYDMDFDVCCWDKYNNKQFNMVICKSTPWDYDKLKDFIDGLNNIPYKYTLRFSYLKRPSANEAIALFYDWYRSIYSIDSKLTLASEKDDIITFYFDSEEKKQEFSPILRDFKDFLDFIFYEFLVLAKVDEAPSNKDFDSSISREITEKKDIDDDDLDDFLDDEDDFSFEKYKKVVAEESQENSKIVEESLLNEMKKNAENMKRERKRARLYRKGNYVHIEAIDAIDTNSQNVDFNGKVFSCDSKDYGGINRYTLGVADDFGGAIYVKYKENKNLNSKLFKDIKQQNVRIRGAAYFDSFTKSLMVNGHFLDLLPPDEIQVEPYEQNRVELHLHTKMSTQDGVTNMIDYCNYAKALGHKAIAITDHGCVQGFPEAALAAKKTGMKILYGAELYMTDDKPSYAFNEKDISLKDATFVVFDLETTGLSARYCKIIEFGAVKVQNGLVVDRLDLLINPECKIPEKIIQITSIDDKMVKNEPTIKELLPQILSFIGDSILVTHNAKFDYSFLNQACIDNGFEEIKNGVIDTLALSHYLFPESKRHNLGGLCRNMNIQYNEDEAHRADYDAFVLNEVWQPMIFILSKDNEKLKHSELNCLVTPKSSYRFLRPSHCIVLCKNKSGLKDLYKLISISNIDYLSDLPKIPKSVIEKYRTNLIIGSSCLNGEVFKTAQYYNGKTLERVMSFYDYIEVQPLENYSILWNLKDVEEEDVKKYLLDIINAAKNVNKMIVATGDVHYKTEKEKIFRDVYIYSKAVGGVPHALYPYSRSKLPYFENPNQHYRTTKEMLDCFAFLGEETAKEIVITNTNIIADSIEEIEPIPGGKLFTPTIAGCEKELSDMCYKKAREIYGDPLPEFIKDRLSVELNGIIKHGFSVIYYIAHKIVKKANEDGYLVGSRGSVGSSFVATMADITEVNPLPPHYICPKCKKLEWTKEEMPQYRSGYDLPPKRCPCCGELMNRDGQDIPFATFLGFEAEKTPDIDLNFPGDYQPNAFEYTKVLLGAKNVFRAGTIETVADKTAFGYVKGYLERSGHDVESFSKAKIEYIVSGVAGAKRTTGQHPGGIVVVPSEYDVYDFTPIQYPAEKEDATWKTTHFDFHSLHDTILKLDLLGHVDPVALRMMCNLLNVNIKDIPIGDEKVLSLFSSNEALNLKNNYLKETTGALGIPEFGTGFVRRFLEKVRPKTFNDLVIISGLSHGQGVWQGNAEDLIDKKIATLQEVIGCRDDIMTYLISKGIPSGEAFAIMEDVRKGRGLNETFLEIMKAHNIPQFYIDSCKKIKYMFPKGHAVAYVTMAVRVGYFKVYHPLEYYATFFSVRCEQYDINAMVKGEKAMIEEFEKLKNKEQVKKEKLDPKEKELYKTFQIAIEMAERGFKFTNIDLYKSDATKFIVDHENNALIPPFITLSGLGANNASTIIMARANGEFMSIDDLLDRTKLSKSNVKDLEELGVLQGLNKKNEFSLFDFDFS